MSRFKVFWIDDEYEKQRTFIRLAEAHNIDLIPFKSLEGLKNLFDNYNNYDTVLLDVKFIETDTSTEPAHNKWAYRAKEQIEAFDKKKFEITFFSGQESTFENEDSFFDNHEGKYDILDKEKHQQECIEVLLKKCRDQESFQIKQQNREFFDAAVNVLSEEHCYDFLNILLGVNNGGSSFNSIRTVLESDLIDFLEENNVTPKFPVARTNKLKQCSLFLNGSVVFNWEIQNKDLVAHRISKSFAYLNEVLNFNSHSLKNIKNRNFLLGICYIAMDLVIWADETVQGDKKILWKQYSNQGEIAGKSIENYTVKMYDFKLDRLHCPKKYFSREHDIGDKLTFEIRNRKYFNPNKNGYEFEYFLYNVTPLS